MAERKKKKGLTTIQRKFLEEYVKDYNGTRAYMRACPNVTYSSAHTLSGRILKMPEAKEYLDKLEREIYEAYRINAEHIATELAKIAFMDDEATKKDKMKAMELLQKQLGLQQQNIKADVNNDIIITVGE